jgi:hypothetical protein
MKTMTCHFDLDVITFISDFFLDDAVANFKDVVGLIGLIMSFMDVELKICLPPRAGNESS